MGAGAAGMQVNPPRQLVGHKVFKRNNPMTDRFPMHKFLHFEFYCQDATNVSKRFGYGMGMTMVAKSDQGTGNHTYASYVMKSNEVVFTFTAPYGLSTNKSDSQPPLPYFDCAQAHAFVADHGLAVRAVGVAVDDAAEAFRIATENGAVAMQSPVVLEDASGAGKLTVSEVKLYGDVALRFVSGDYHGVYMPGYEATPEAPVQNFGLQRVDHAVGNVPDLIAQVNYLCDAVGFHEFAEFTAEDVGTVDSGLNSMVLASNNEMVLLPINEPTFGTKRKSQIQTYLEQNAGAGLQHLALKTDDIFATMKLMQERSPMGGFEFMPRPSDAYYRELPSKIGEVLTPAQYAECERMGLLVDRDDQGVL
ncbi:hypothetical protein H632_c1538p1, partial [Helicosporidium sp. ATCC 50920]